MKDAGTTRQLADSFEPLSLKPAPRQALVRVIAPEKVSKGGIILPDTAATAFGASCAGPSLRRWCGEVMRIGNSPEWDGVEVGDVVQWGKYTNNELVHRGVTYVIMDVEQVESVIDPALARGRQDKDVRGSWDPDAEEG